MTCVKLILGLAVGVALLYALTIPAEAGATTPTDILVGMRTLPLLSDKPTGKVTIAIVYDPNSPVSKNDADSVMSAFVNASNASGTLKYEGIMVPVNDLGKLANVKAAFVMEGARASMDDIYTAANAAHVVTMSSDLSCVHQNKCTLGIVTGDSSVQIYYSQIAADAAKVNFTQSFLMLVQHV